MPDLRNLPVNQPRKRKSLCSPQTAIPLALLLAATALFAFGVYKFKNDATDARTAGEKPFRKSGPHSHRFVMGKGPWHAKAEDETPEEKEKHLKAAELAYKKLHHPGHLGYMHGQGLQHRHARDHYEVHPPVAVHHPDHSKGEHGWMMGEGRGNGHWGVHRHPHQPHSTEGENGGGGEDVAARHLLRG